MSITKLNEEAAVFGVAGPTLTVRTPSGDDVEIREWNAEDEDAISKIKDNKDGTHTYKFLAGIITKINGVPVKLSWEEVAKLKVRDIYYLLFKGRLFTHGDKLAFDHTFESGEVVPQIEDLAKFDFNLASGEPPKKGEEGYSAEQIKPYPKGVAEWVEKTTSRGLKYRFKLLTGMEELATRQKKIEDATINDKLRNRSFSLFHGGTWQQIERFNMISAKESSEIRSVMNEIDHEFSLIITVKSPSGAVEATSIFAIPDFYYPQS